MSNYKHRGIFGNLLVGGLSYVRAGWGYIAKRLIDLQVGFRSDTFRG